MYPSLHLQPMFAMGWMGVDLFFVLSGFLITGILLDATASENYFKNFYARRCLRIWPLYYSVLFLMFVAVPMLRPSEGPIIFGRASPWWSYPLYLQNVLVTKPLSSKGALAVTWSLAIEEQFYLVWPLIVRYCSRLQLRRIALFIICVSPVLRLYLSTREVDLYINVFCRLDGLMAGALLALAVRSNTFVPTEFVKRAWLGLLVAVPLAFLSEAFGTRWMTYSLSALASVSFIYLSLFSSQKWLQRGMTNRLLVYTGTISYGLYLLHKFPFDVAEAIGLNHRFPLLALPIALFGCYVLAASSWILLEKPFLKMKRLFEPRPLIPIRGELA
jgi:peptidoglycan/LPS O-acetylase OafA/YrhL